MFSQNIVPQSLGVEHAKVTCRQSVAIIFLRPLLGKIQLLLPKLLLLRPRTMVMIPRMSPEKLYGNYEGLLLEWSYVPAE